MRYRDLLRAIWRISRPVLLPWRSRMEQRVAVVEAKFNAFQDSMIAYGETLEERMKILGDVTGLDEEPWPEDVIRNGYDPRDGKTKPRPYAPTYPIETREGPIGPHRAEDEIQ